MEMTRPNFRTALKHKVMGKKPEDGHIRKMKSGRSMPLLTAKRRKRIATRQEGATENINVNVGLSKLYRFEECIFHL